MMKHRSVCMQKGHRHPCAKALPTWSAWLALLIHPESRCIIFSVQKDVLAQSRGENFNRQKYTVQFW